ncbi:unnamed protein product [Urochloa humidicola]
MKNGASDAVTLEDTGALNCVVCHLPLKPPIFQCIKGHAVCPSCREETKKIAGGNSWRCHASSGSCFLPSHAMDRLVESVRVPCPHAAHGCAARLAYYDRRSHGEACPYAPRVCPFNDCDFAGAMGALLDHLAGAHFDVDAVRQFWAQELASALAGLGSSVAAHEAGITPGDIDLVMLQATVSRDVAIKAIKKNGGDIVSAIMELTCPEF